MNKNMLKKFTNKNGITLITLIITIVVLIILVGVAINISIGNNGIFKKAKEAKNKYNETVAREKLELILEEARIDKETKNEYNSEEYLNNLLESKGITVNENEVIVDNYNFKIDREKLTITEILGETEIKITSEVQEYLGKNANNKYEASILLKIESNSSLQKVTIQNPDGTILEIETDKLKLDKDITVEFDKQYIVTAITKDGKTQTGKIIEKTEEIIRTAEELVVLRDKVNKGLTYEGKIIKQAKDIELNTVCNSEIGTWIPIGNAVGIYFLGTYDGDNNELKNLYIKTNQEFAIGLFGRIGYTGKIQNLTVTGHVERTNFTDSAIGAIVGRNEGTIENVTNKANIISGGDSAGGIAGNNINTITKCTNSGSITSEGYYVGGICGISNGSITNANITEDIQPKIRQCKNTSEVTIRGTQNVGGILGGGLTKIDIGQCYNAGTINGSSNVGGIAGYIGNDDGKYGYIGNCYNIGDVNATNNRAGGLVGIIVPGLKEVVSSYNIGKITCIQYVGGVIGENNGVLYNIYYLNKGGVTYGCGINNSSTGLEEAEGSTEQTFKNLAKKFNDYAISVGNNPVWKNDETNINNGYPILLWQIEK